MTQELYTVAEAANILKLHVKTLRRKIRDGELESTRVGKQYRISRQQLEAFCGQELSDEPVSPVGVRRHVFTSTVVAVDAISADDSSRLTNQLMGALNAGPGNPRVDCLYHPEIGQLKVIVNGDLTGTREILSIIEFFFGNDNQQGR
jgi:excisionase family DNA binding protein